MTRSSRPAEGRAPAERRSGGDPGGGLAVLAALGQAVGTAIVTADQPAGPGPFGYALLVVTALATSDRLRHPRATLVAVAVLTVAYSALGFPQGVSFLGLVVAGAGAARAGHRGVLALTAVAAFAAGVALTAPTPGRALVVAACGAGAALAVEVVLVVAGAIRRAEREQRRARTEQQRREAGEERLRIAQELHDVLGHHLSLINVRAGVGSHLLDRDPEEARAALDTIKAASAEALLEVQSVLTVLDPSDRAAPRAPAPGLDRLDELTVDAGLPVRVTVSGTARPLPAGVDLAAYRIVQEALTNVRRHAGLGATAAIAVEHRPDRLVVQVDDTGGTRDPAAVTGPPGTGIGGMRVRATLLGGSLTAGPRAGGWRVRAELPVAAAEPDPAEQVGLSEQAGPV
jgi:signal transduction histidine kinase